MCFSREETYDTSIKVSKFVHRIVNLRSKRGEVFRVNKTIKVISITGSQIFLILIVTCNGIKRWICTNFSFINFVRFL